jgi:hypothetical protein
MRGLPRSLAPARAAVLVAVGVGLILGAGHLPAPLDLAHRTTPGAVARVVADPVSLTRLICPGPEALGIEGLPDSSRQTVSVTAAGAPAASLPRGFATGTGDGSLAISGLPSGGRWAAPVVARGAVLSGQLSTAQSALITGAGALAPGTVGTQWSLTATGTTRGLVSSACMPTAASSWLVAGGAEPGRLEHLVLANPGANPVTVDLRVLGAAGPISSPDGQGLVVAGRGRTVILLDAITGSEPSPAVQVIARGGKVAAVLSESWLDGVVPRGGDDAVPVAAPAREQVIAGVPIDGRATLRVAVPGGVEAVVQTRVLTPGGPRPLPADGVTRVAGGSTRDIDLGSLPAGAYAVQVRADVPVVAAAMVDRRGAATAPSDLAWSGASPPIRTLAGMALPASGVRGLGQRLDLAATGNPASVRVTTVGADGRVRSKEVTVAADSVFTMSVEGASSNRATSVWVTPLAGIVRAAVLTTVTDASGQMLSLTPLADLPLTVTASPLRQLLD